MTGNERTLVLIADDHAVLHMLLDAQVDMLAVGEAETAEQAAPVRESLIHFPRKVARFS
jgi:hypothetical protein